MPWFFQFSKNGRRASQRNKKYQKPNDSTMNKICNTFNDIKNINFSKANVGPLNYQMFLASNIKSINKNAIEDFCKMDSAESIKEIKQSEANDIKNKEIIMNYTIIAQDISETLISKYGSLEEIYPSIVKYLFTGENINKQTHKQMFWRIFGKIAVRNLKTNSENCYTCDSCGSKIPNWTKLHACSKPIKGFFLCVDCGKTTKRTNGRQCRCSECNEIYRKNYKAINEKRRRKKAS